MQPVGKPASSERGGSAGAAAAHPPLQFAAEAAGMRSCLAPTRSCDVGAAAAHGLLAGTQLSLSAELAASAARNGARAAVQGLGLVWGSQMGLARLGGVSAVVRSNACAALQRRLGRLEFWQASVCTCSPLAGSQQSTAFGALTVLDCSVQTAPAFLYYPAGSK